jgi:hypothetical protein
VAATYQVLVEQVNGLAIFDDCDSVVADKDGKNMLKKALDTDPVRDVSYNSKKLLNTKVMEKEVRDLVVGAISNICAASAKRMDVHILMTKVQGKEDSWYEIPHDEYYKDRDPNNPEDVEYLKRCGA